MTWQAWGANGEGVGGVAVLVTLVYLAVQTRQARRSAWSQAPQWISDGNRSWIAATREDAEFGALVTRAIHGWDDLDELEHLRVHSWWGEKIVHLDAVPTLRDQGLTEEERAEAWIGDSLSLILSPGGAEWWKASKHVFVRKVRDRLDARLEDPASLPDAFTQSLPFFRKDPRDAE